MTIPHVYFAKMQVILDLNDMDYREAILKELQDVHPPRRIFTDEECADIVIANIYNDTDTLTAIYKKAETREKARLTKIKSGHNSESNSKPISNNTNNDINYQFQKYDFSSILNQVSESLDIINSTTNPDTFFNRLNFILDRLLFINKKSCSIDDINRSLKIYNDTINDLENIVNEFIDRSYYHEHEIASKLKTEKERKNRLINYFKNPEISFGNSNDHYHGNNPEFHYSGRLYTDRNLMKIAELEKNLDLNVNNLFTP